jgi:hypothetical protein
MGKSRKSEEKEYVFDSRTCVRLTRLPSLGGERNMSVKVPKETMNGTTHVGENATGRQY